jgi:hypothetical protein
LRLIFLKFCYLLKKRDLLITQYLKLNSVIIKKIKIFILKHIFIEFILLTFSCINLNIIYKLKNKFYNKYLTNNFIINEVYDKYFLRNSLKLNRRSKKIKFFNFFFCFFKNIFNK